MSVGHFVPWAGGFKDNLEDINRIIWNWIVKSDFSDVYSELRYRGKIVTYIGPYIRTIIWCTIRGLKKLSLESPMKKDLKDQKYQVCISVTRVTDEVLHKVGEDNRSDGVRLLAEQYAASEAADIRNELDVLYSSERITVPGDHAFVWPKCTRDECSLTNAELNRRIRNSDMYVGKDKDIPEDAVLPDVNVNDADDPDWDDGPEDDLD